MKIIFGTRGSALALAQTEQIMALFSALHPAVEAEKKIIKTSGDRDQHSSLSSLGGWGAFTRELEKELIAGTIDAAVHSLKDLPTEQPEPLTIVAVAARAPVEDVLLTNEDFTLDTLPSGAVVGTSSLRREVQLRRFRPDLCIKDIRGNVQTRIDKLRRHEYDAILLARAGLSRLALLQEKGLYIIPVTMMIPAPGQGAIAIEIRKSDNLLQDLLLPLNDEQTAACVQFERSALRSFGGGCRSPLAIHAAPHASGLEFQSFVAESRNRYFFFHKALSSWNTVTEEGDALGQMLQSVSVQTESAHKTPEDALSGKKILVTRAHHQSKPFCDSLRTHGAEVLELPFISIQGVAFEKPSLKDSWLIFTSANAVHHFVNPEGTDPASCRFERDLLIGAIGTGTAEALSEYGVTTPYIPQKGTAKVFANELTAKKKMSGITKAVIPCGDKALPELSELLVHQGWTVETPVCYRTVIARLTEGEKQAIINFRPDVITTFSPTAVESMMQNGIPENLQKVQCAPLYASIGPTTTQELQRRNCTPVLESFLQSGTGLCDALCAYYEGLH